MSTWPKLESLYGIEVHVSPHMPDDKIVLVGREEWKDPLHFTRQISVWDLKTGKVSGNVHEGQVQRIEVSEANRSMFDQPKTPDQTNETLPKGGI